MPTGGGRQRREQAEIDVHRLEAAGFGAAGDVAEQGAERASLFARPQHPYTEALLSAVPVPDPDAAKKRIILHGDVPSPIHPPPGCRFHTRCPYAFDRCSVEEPQLREVLPGQFAACHLRDAGPAAPTAAVPAPTEA